MENKDQNTVYEADPISEIGLDKQLREIYSAKHLSRLEVLRLFKPILKLREMEQEKMFRSAQGAFQHMENPLDEIGMFLSGYLLEKEISESQINDLQKQSKKILQAIQQNNGLQKAVLDIDQILFVSFGLKEDNNKDDSFGQVLIQFGCDYAKSNNLKIDFSDLAPQIKRYQNAASRSRERLMEGLQQYIVKIARETYPNRGVPFEDLIQEGNIGLMKAIDKFEPSRGNALITYATDWIHQTMSRACTNNGSLEKYHTRIPCHMYLAIGKVQKAFPILQKELGREPTAKELVEKCSKVTLLQVKTALEVLSRSTFSLDAQTQNDDSDTSMGDFIPDTRASDPLVKALQGEQRERMLKIFNTLGEEEKQIISMRLDLEERGKPYTQEEVCNQLGIKKSKMLNVQNRAYNRMLAALGNPSSIENELL